MTPQGGTSRESLDLTLLRAELRQEMARLELRATKWTGICAVCAIAVTTLVAVLLSDPGVGLPRAGAFVAGTALQVYAVWRM